VCANMRLCLRVSYVCNWMCLCACMCLCVCVFVCVCPGWFNKFSENQ